MAQLLTPKGIKNFSLAPRFVFSTVAQTVRKQNRSAVGHVIASGARQSELGTDNWELLFNREVREPRER
jgi:hypothetical protein